MMNGRYSIVLVLVLLAALVGAVQARKPAGPPADRAVYVPVPSLDVSYSCSSSGIIAQFDYWPSQAETTYTARFYAQGGGTVTLILPFGYDDAVDIPVDNEQRAYTLSVTTPPASGANAVSIRLAYQAPHCTESPDSFPTRVRALNISVAP